jgi:UDP-N-acetyl-2-amino-2-deoxyglucuronate dehydrogenase
MKNFALIGAAGFVAPRHMEAIKKVGGNLIAAADPHDSVGVLDKYFPHCEFFNTPKNFRDFLRDETVDYLVICSPNYLHFPQIYACGRYVDNIICEKPLCLHAHQLETISQLDCNIYTILQLRYHPEIIKLKNEISRQSEDYFNHVIIDYTAPRGPWYHKSWKGQTDKSGGILINIGIHIFDLIQWLFGSKIMEYHYIAETEAAYGYLKLKKTEIAWKLSTVTGKDPLRLFTVNDSNIDLSSHIENLHVKSYDEILKGRGFKVEDAKKSLKFIETWRR